MLHFGEMGGRWGINRTVGQIYALLFLSERPLNADDVQKLGNAELMRLLALGAGVSKLLDAKNKIVNFGRRQKDDDAAENT